MPVTSHSSRIADDLQNPLAPEKTNYTQTATDGNDFTLALAIHTGLDHTIQLTNTHKWQWRRVGGTFVDILDGSGEIRFSSLFVDHDEVVAAIDRLTTGGTYIASGKQFDKAATLNYGAVLSNDRVTEIWAGITIEFAAAGITYEFRVFSTVTPDSPNGSTASTILRAKLIKLPALLQTGNTLTKTTKTTLLKPTAIEALDNTLVTARDSRVVTLNHKAAKTIDRVTTAIVDRPTTLTLSKISTPTLLDTKSQTLSHKSTSSSSRVSKKGLEL